MKKILFCAGLVALATSCTQDELLNESFAEQSKGITFSAEVPDPVGSRGYLTVENGKFPFFWYAEKDRINIYANGDVAAGSENENNLGIVEDWTNIGTGAQYKATKSMANGDFTAINDANLIEFKDAVEEVGKPVEARFVATFNSSLSKVDLTDDNVTSLTISPNVGIENQDFQTDDISDIAPMYSYSKSTQGETYNSVGERVGLKFYRPMAVAGFRALGIDQEYKELFGNLKTITLEMKGYTDEDEGEGENDIEASNISYTDTDEIVVDLTATGDAAKTKANVATKNSKIVATYNKSWGGVNREETVFMAMANVDRSAFRTANVKESMVITYEFENIYFVLDAATNNSWVSGDNTVTPMPELDMAKYPFLIVGAEAPYTLIVNSGEFNAIYGGDETMKTIAWNDTEVNVENIEQVISKVAVNFEGLNLMTNVKKLRLDVDTEIPAESLKDLTSLEVINMPAVTSVGKDAFNANLKEVYLPAFTFDNGTAINNMLLKSDYLEKLSMGATNMNASFPENGLLLNGYENLTEVTVKDGIKLGANSFKDCTALTTVNGVVKLLGTGAFHGCTSLSSIVVDDKDVPDYSFSGCSSLASITYKDGTTHLKPNYVGQYAFEGTNVNIDLSETTMIGMGAFKNATGLVGFEWKNQDVVKVGATSIGIGAFSGASNIQFIYFLNETAIDDYMLNGTTRLKEIKFGKTFTYGGEGKPNKGTFGENTKIKLFIVEGQNGIAGNTLTIGPSGKTTTFSFLQIEKED